MHHKQRKCGIPMFDVHKTAEKDMLNATVEEHTRLQSLLELSDRNENR